MMTLDQKIHLTTLLSNPNFIYVCNYCTDNGLTPKEALDLIVQEWRTGKEMKPLTTKKEVNETILEEALKGIEERLNQIEGQLADGQIVILHKE